MSLVDEMKNGWHGSTQVDHELKEKKNLRKNKYKM